MTAMLVLILVIVVLLAVGLLLWRQRAKWKSRALRDEKDKKALVAHVVRVNEITRTNHVLKRKVRNEPTAKAAMAVVDGAVSDFNSGV